MIAQERKKGTRDDLDLEMLGLGELMLLSLQQAATGNMDASNHVWLSSRREVVVSTLYSIVARLTVGQQHSPLTLPAGSYTSIPFSKSSPL